MIPDFDGNLPDDATDSNWNGKCMSVWKEGTPEGTKMTWTILFYKSTLTVYSTAQPPELRNSWPMREKLIDALPPMLNVSHVICAAFILNIITETRKHQEYLTSGIFFNLTGKSNIFFWGVCKTFSHTTRNKSIITETWKHQEYLTSGIFFLIWQAN